jgi:hypothetical protein
MRTAIKETKVFKFEELSEEGKEAAIQELYDINVDYEWWDYDGILPVEFLRWDKIYFDLDRENYLQIINPYVDSKNEEQFREYLKIPLELWEKISYSFYNSHSNWNVSNTKLEIENTDEDELTKEENKVIENAIEIFNDLMHEGLSELKKNYEYLTSEAAIIETIEANEYEFTEAGKLY